MPDDFHDVFEDEFDLGEEDWCCGESEFCENCGGCVYCDCICGETTEEEY